MRHRAATVPAAKAPPSKNRCLKLTSFRVKAKARGLSTVMPPTASTTPARPSKSRAIQWSIVSPVTCSRTSVWASPGLVHPADVPARGESLVDLGVLREQGMALDPQVARDGDHRRRVGRRVDREDVQGVGEVLPAVPLAARVPEEGDVDRRSAGEGSEQRGGQARSRADRAVEGIGTLPQEHRPDEQAADDEQETRAQHAPNRDATADRLLVAGIRQDRGLVGGDELHARRAGVDALLPEPLLPGDGGLEPLRARRGARLGTGQ